MILFLQPFPFCLGKPQIVGAEGISVTGFSGGLLLFCQQGHTNGTLVHSVLRGQNQIGKLRAEGIEGEVTAVTNQIDGAIQLLQRFCKIG